MTRRAIYVTAALLILASGLLGLKGRPEPAVIDVDSSQWARVRRCQVGEMVRLHGIVFTVERHRTAWKVKLAGHVCYLADGSRLVPGDSARIVGTVWRTDAPDPHPVVLVDCWQE